MATNPLLVFQNRPFDLQNNLLKGEQIQALDQRTKQQERLLPLRERLFKAQAGSLEAGASQTQQDIDINNKALERQELVEGLAEIQTLLSIESEEERRLQHNEFERGRGLDPDSDPNPDSMVTEDLIRQGRAIQARLAQDLSAQKRRPTQFEPVGLFEDEAGNRFDVVNELDPNDKANPSRMLFTNLDPNGVAEPVGQLQALGGQFKETPDEKVLRERLQKQNASNIEIAEALAKERQKLGEQQVNASITAGVNAADVIPQYNQMLDLLAVVETGRPQEIEQSMRRVFGREDATLGQLDVLFKQAVLANIRKLGANPTEGEREFLLDTTASIGQNKALAEKIIRDNLTKAQRERDIAEEILKKRDDENSRTTLEIINRRSAPLPAVAAPAERINIGRFSVRQK